LLQEANEEIIVKTNLCIRGRGKGKGKGGLDLASVIEKISASQGVPCCTFKCGLVPYK